MASPAPILYWFDFVCPFCYVAQQRNAIFGRRGLDVVHLPFQIHPEIPVEGVDAGLRTGPMYATLEREAARVGLPLNWPTRLPNTRTALAAAEWVRRRQPDLSGDFNQRLYAAHFALNEDLGDIAVIERQANEVGVDLSALRAALADGTASASLVEAESLGAQFGVRATPSWLVAGNLISGLLPPSEFERLAEEAVARG
ncbi:DsbA family protein [Micromonospora sp. GCM10011542]|uniref:DsbA family oxidoreductase n=1 Tax=Micromonospora sp. GCM10011542 TaxID=3317337 RepID=UPI0036099058